MTPEDPFAPRLPEGKRGGVKGTDSIWCPTAVVVNWTVECISERVAAVAKEAKTDNETAHIDEDDLRREFIEWVRDYAPEPWNTLAAEVLKTPDFEHWYA